MVITEAVRAIEPTMNHQRPITSRANKPPVYTSDKRAKFTQRENKQWVRLATVVGYLIAVCIPAIALSVYYVGFWDPQYKIKITNDSLYRTDAAHLANVPLNREIRSHDIEEPRKCPTCACKSEDKPTVDSIKSLPNLNSLLTGKLFSDTKRDSALDFDDDYQSTYDSRENSMKNAPLSSGD